MQHQLLINGQWTTGTGSTFTSYNPCTDEIIWQGNAGAAEDIDAAVKAARNAFPAWMKIGFSKRAELLGQYRKVLQDEKEKLSAAISLETGKPEWEAQTEAAALLSKVDISIEAYQQRTGESVKEISGMKSVVRHKPHGVIAIFGPFNFPAHLPNGHIVPALLAGNTLVYKPSELTPLVAEIMTQCLEKAGLPKGVINLVQGQRETGITLAKHPGIDGLFFTGSQATGTALHKQFAGDTGKILALELGGNNPLIVHETYDLNAAVYHTIQSAYITAGQRCSCARRLIVPIGKAGDQFIEKLSSALQQIIVGPPHAKPTPFMGPVISNGSADHLLAAQNRLIAAGGNPLHRLERIQANKPFLKPALIDVTNVNSLPDEEYFGPLLQLIRVKNFAAAIQAANQTRYGLAAGILTDNKELWEEFYLHSRAGIVNWNRPLTGASSNAPFGGIGASGNHRPSAYYAADYSAYPVATLQDDKLLLPEKLTPGITL